MAIHLGLRFPGSSSGVPGPSAGRVSGTCFALHRTGFGEPPCHHGAGGLLPHRFTLTGACAPAVSSLFHFPSAFAAWGFPSVLPCGVRTFLGRSKPPAATRPAPPVYGAARSHIASTGTAFAGIVITGANVKNNSLSGLDVRNGSLTTLDVKNHSLLPVDFKKLPSGAAGPAGPAGPQGRLPARQARKARRALPASAVGSGHSRSQARSTAPRRRPAKPHARPARSSSAGADGYTTCKQCRRRSRFRSRTRPTTTPGASSAPR